MKIFSQPTAEQRDHTFIFNSSLIVSSTRKTIRPKPMQELIQKIAEKRTKKSKVANTSGLPNMQDSFPSVHVSGKKRTFCLNPRQKIKNAPHLNPMKIW